MPDCPSCGGDVDSEDSYCRHCGLQLSEKQPINRPQQGFMETMDAEIRYDAKLFYYLWPSYLVFIFGYLLIVTLPTSFIKTLGAGGVLFLLFAAAITFNVIMYHWKLKPSESGEQDG